MKSFAAVAVPHDASRALVALVSADGSVAHPHLRTLTQIDKAAATRAAADAVHHLCMLHGRHPGVVDHAAARLTIAGPREALFAIADAFAAERDVLARLVVAAGPIPGTPGQAETEASVIAQRHAIDMLAQSDRAGCAVGAALALVLDWHAIRRVIEAAARRFGVEVAATRLPGQAVLATLASDSCPTPATERALLFGAQQIATQHRGLWDLLEARAAARRPD